jgi:hypothetical protein
MSTSRNTTPAYRRKPMSTREFEITETGNGDFRIKIKCNNCGKFVKPVGMPIRLEYLADSGERATSNGYMHLVPDTHSCE